MTAGDNRRRYPVDTVAVDACVDGRLSYFRLGQWERIHAVHRLAACGLNDTQIGLRLGLNPRNVLGQRRKPLPRPKPRPLASTYTPQEDAVNCDCHRAPAPVHTIDEIAEHAQNLCDDIAGYPDLAHVLANAELIAEHEPRLAAQIMMALAAWVPVDDTLDDRKDREEQLRRQRRAEGLPTLHERAALSVAA